MWSSVISLVFFLSAVYGCTQTRELALPLPPLELTVGQIGIDIACGCAPPPPCVFSCIKSSGYSLVFINGYNPTGQGSYNVNACPSLQNAASVGLSTGVNMIPQPLSTKLGYQQIDEVRTGLYNACSMSVTTIWVLITANEPWPSNVQQNINFISSIINRGESMGIVVGIRTNSTSWSRITNNWNAGSAVPLWYESVNGVGVPGESPANFADFHPFGGWSLPSIKQFGAGEMACMAPVGRHVMNY